MKKIISDYIDVRYFVTFLLVFLFLRYFNLGFVGIVDPRGALYSSFLDHYLNYTIPLRDSILHTAGLIVHAGGLNTVVSSAYIRLMNGHGVFLAFPCLGLMNLSFWAAFIITHSASKRKKIIWFIAGSFAIWLINCFRIALLLVAINHKLNVNSIADHHDLYNYVSYVLIAVLVYAFTRNGQRTVNSEQRTMNNEQ